MKVFTIVGARPQLIKAGPVSRCLRSRHMEFLLHTGQHYDDALSAVFFRELGLAAPDMNLGVGSGAHGEQTAAMLVGIEGALVQEMPDWVLVYGDTNSTLAGALAASKLHIPVAHVEAGLRSFNRRMPEEINRVVTDHLSTLLFAPSQTAVEHLAHDGIWEGVHLVGDVMADALLNALEHARKNSQILGKLGLAESRYTLVTLHRAENTDDKARLVGILSALERMDGELVFPVHPRTRKAMAASGFTFHNPHIRLIEPVGYLDMVRLESSARRILTDFRRYPKRSLLAGGAVHHTAG